MGSSASPHPCQSRTPTPVGRLGGSSRDEDRQNRVVFTYGSPSQASLSGWGGSANWLHKPPWHLLASQNRTWPRRAAPVPPPPTRPPPCSPLPSPTASRSCGVAEPRSLGHGRMGPGGKGTGGGPSPASGGTRAHALCCPGSRVLRGEAGGREPEPAAASPRLRCGPSSLASSHRLFSLHVPVPPKIFLSMVYKLEGPSDVGVALELTTGDAGSCHVGGISTLSGEGVGLAPAS